MDAFGQEEFEFELNPEEPVFMIGIVSDLIGIPIWTLRRLDDMGIVTPYRVGNRTRCYSKRQLKKLKFIFYLMEEKHVNLDGIKVIMEMREEDR